MKKSIIGPVVLIFLSGLLLMAGCKTNSGDLLSADREPFIEPDYSGVTIPPNITPLNFIIKESGKHFLATAGSGDAYNIRVRSKNGVIRFPERAWKKLLAANQGKKITIAVISEDEKGVLTEYDPVELNVSGDAIDPWISYRLLYPGYESYKQILIRQRNTESFRIMVQYRL